MAADCQPYASGANSFAVSGLRGNVPWGGRMVPILSCRAETGANRLCLPRLTRCVVFSAERSGLLLDHARGSPER